MTLFSLLRLLLPACALLLATAPARAGLTVCNKTAQKVTLAIGKYDGVAWISQGWWNAKPGECVELVSGKLLARYYYLFATDDAFETWQGGKAFCVGLFDSFEIKGRGNCGARGFDRHGFFEIDTGNFVNWTQTLSNPR